MNLVWRTYRDPDHAPVPLVRARVQVNYEYVPKQDYSVTREPSRPIVRAVSLVDGTETDTPTRLPAALVEYDGESPMGTTRDVVGTVEPSLVFDRDRASLLIPHMQAPGDPVSRRVRAYPLYDGVFQVPQGYPKLGRVHVDGAAYEGVIIYESNSGILVLEDGGVPVHQLASVEVSLAEDITDRADLEDLPDGLHPVTREGVRAGGELIGHLRKKTSISYTDVRKLPEPERGTQHHAVDHGYYDGSPISTRHLWIIRTDAPTDRVEAACRRTLPAGSMWRVEPLTS